MTVIEESLDFMQENFGIRGIFKNEIYDRFSVVIDMVIANNLLKEDFQNTNFGIYYCSLVFKEKEKLKTLRILLLE